MEIPVYLFTGFLESGKTTYIQETLENAEFNSGERTLLLLCEEGVEEYAPERFASDAVHIHVIDSIDELTEENLTALAAQTECERIIVEYNGMWTLDALDAAMPMEWPIYQQFFFADAGSIMSYYKNMHSLVVDKLQDCELVVFNRFQPHYDKQEYHRLVRGTTRRADIIYEDTDHMAEIDDIEDPLPYDMDAPVVEINDEDYAIFYSDLAENTADYKNKRVKFVAMVNKPNDFPPDMFVIGRPIMTCCVDDIRFAGLFCRWKDCSNLQKGQWMSITAQIALTQQKSGQLVPVLLVETLKKTDKPDPEVAALY